MRRGRIITIRKNDSGQLVVAVPTRALSKELPPGTVINADTIRDPLARILENEGVRVPRTRDNKPSISTAIGLQAIEALGTVRVLTWRVEGGGWTVGREYKEGPFKVGRRVGGVKGLTHHPIEIVDSADAPNFLERNSAVDEKGVCEIWDPLGRVPEQKTIEVPVRRKLWGLGGIEAQLPKLPRAR